MTDQPSICAQVLADYNAGELLYTWIDCTIYDEDEIWEQIYALMRKSNHPNVEVDCPQCDGEGENCSECKGSGKVPSAEEWEIADTSAFGSFADEVVDVKSAIRAAKLMEERGSAATAAASHFVGLDEIEKALKVQHVGVYDSVADYVQETEEGCIEIPDYLAGYIDWKRYAEDNYPNIIAVRVITDARLHTSELHLFDTERDE